MNERAPKLPPQEAANKNESPEVAESMTPEQVAEKIAESIEKAQGIQAELLPYDRVDMYGQEATDAMNETRVLSAQLKEALFYIPAGDCLKNGLPSHPTDEKYEYPRSSFPAAPDYPLGYDPKPGDGVGVDQQQTAAQAT